MPEAEPSTHQPAELSPARRALLARWLHGALGQPTANPILQRRPAGPAPMSFAQERLWFLQQLEPQSPAYHITRCVRFEGLLDVAALRQALEQIVVRHEALRTTFPVLSG